MKLSYFSAFPVTSLVLYYNRAIDEKHWLEAIVLAHMYIETQLRTILGKEVRQDKKGNYVNVIDLAKKAKKKNKISDDLLKKITEFNTSRNDTVHNLPIGIITYEDLESPAKQAGHLIHELQALHMYKAFHPGE